MNCPHCGGALVVVAAPLNVATPIAQDYHGTNGQPAPEWNRANANGLYCPVHGTPAVIKPAGTRRDGSTYPAFPVCADPACRIRPARQNAPQAAQGGPGAPAYPPVLSESTRELP